MATDTEIRQAVVAFLTAERADADSGTGELLPVVGNIISVDIGTSHEVGPQTSPQDIQRMIQADVAACAAQVGHQAAVALRYAAEMFLSLAHDYELIYPDADIDGFLRRFALALEAGED